MTAKRYPAYIAHLGRNQRIDEWIGSFLSMVYWALSMLPAAGPNSARNFASEAKSSTTYDTKQMVLKLARRVTMKVGC